MRRLIVLVSAAILGAIALAPVAVVGPGPVRAAVPIVVGRTTGTIECRRYDYETSNGIGRTPQMPCDRTWSVDVVESSEWEFSESRRFDGRAGNGISYVQTISQDAGFTLTLDEFGNLTELDLNASLRTTVSHAGDTSVVLNLDIPFTAGPDPLRIQDSISVVATGHDNFFAKSEVDVSLECGDDSVGNRILRQRSRDFGNRSVGNAPELDAAIETGDGNCVLHVLARIDARNSSIIKSDHDAKAEADIELKLSVPPCDVSGIVRDGDAAFDLHDNPMSGIRVTAYQDDSEIDSDVTGTDGRYCFRDMEPGDYDLRGSLVYETHDPWIFRTLYGQSPLPENTEREIVEEDFGRDDLDLVFDSTAERPGRADAANIHWQSTRFVDWLIGSGFASVEELDRFTITALSGDPSSNYDGRTKDVHLKDVATPFASRDSGIDLCPENCEWHEIAHHVGNQLGIAPYLSARCTERFAAHGGWRNGSTCDSIGEGFATFLSALGSLTIDAGRGGDYATPEYSTFGSLEDDTHRPWTVFTSGGTVFGREDFAVSELLWDLVDATPGESGELALVTPRDVIPTPDAMAIDGRGLVRLMADHGVMTVVDLYTHLEASDIVDPALKQPTVQLDGDRAHDVSPLAALFLVHDFHPVHDLTVPWYTVGDPIAATNRQAVDSTTGRPPGSAPPTGATSLRNTMIEMPGAAVEFTNSTSAAVTYEVDVVYPQTRGHREVTVEPGERVVVHLELPPYWRTFAEPGVLPACGSEHDRVVTMTIRGGGAEPRTISNCEYWQLIAATAGDFALTFPAAAPTPGASGGGTAGPGSTTGPDGAPVPDSSGQVPIEVIAAAVVIVVLGALLFIVARRRRGRTA